ncbi:hypothetical protein CH296_19760 [Rhodococcus sp. 14-2496-1d]|uniref:hypothetical protein n=1 Tax=Rhodococcus sp. 14-2496-1d TaxID=2023146 RepID=UPI000B9BB23B|nr:hypothetical protein [Rhodococcus sp. 14-2496-1d]OZF28359.1 hypothetical protein CH296_19760 [Rhodococcus sp. 14-2496-1d]
MIVLRLFGLEVLAVGNPELDETEPDALDNTAGSFELADPELTERDHDVYLASKRHRPPIVAIGSKHQRSTTPVRAFGFRPKM